MPMIFPKLEQLVAEEQRKGSLPQYTRNMLKEYLQIHVLYFVYTSPAYQKALVFTGGTCLRHFFGLPRLSEDLDFDCVTPVQHAQLRDGLLAFFRMHHRYTELQISLKQQESQLLLKFPVLHRLGIAEVHESPNLHVKVDLAPNPSVQGTIQANAASVFGWNFVARHYDLPALMAGKLHAILTRRYLRGQENRVSVKGRDYFDLLWYIKRGVQPNMGRLADMLGERVFSLEELATRIAGRVREATTTHRVALESDLIPLIGDPAMVRDYVKNFPQEYERYKAQSFAPHVRLMLTCPRCHKEFFSGIEGTAAILAGLHLERNKHTCPHCGAVSTARNSDYHRQ